MPEERLHLDEAEARSLYSLICSVLMLEEDEQECALFIATCRRGLSVWDVYTIYEDGEVYDLKFVYREGRFEHRVSQRDAPADLHAHLKAGADLLTRFAETAAPRLEPLSTPLGTPKRDRPSDLSELGSSL